MSRSLLKSISIVSLMTLLSRLLGFVRDMVFAHLFGAGAEMGAFLVAFKIPNFMRRLFAEGAFSQAFVPIFSEYKEKQTLDEVRLFLSRVIGTLAVALCVVTLLGMFAAKYWVMVFAPGFIQEGAGQLTLATDLLRLTFPYLLFISLTACFAGVLNSYRRFAIPAVTPVILNIVLIIAAFLGVNYGSEHGIYAVAWGVMVAGVAQLCFLLPALQRQNMLVWPRWGWQSPGVQRVLKLMGPAIFGASVAQISLLLDTVFASFLKTGSIAWLYYSDRLMQFPLGMLGVALSTVCLPHLSTYFSRGDEKNFAKVIDWSLRLVLLLAVPAALGLALISGPLLTTLFQYGAFSPEDVLQAQKSLIAFAIGLIAFIAIKVLVSAFYARQNVKTPVRIAVWAMGLNLLLNAVLFIPLAHAGLALATSLAAIFNMAALYYGLIKQGIYRVSHLWWQVCWKVIIASSFMSALCYFGVPKTAIWLKWQAGQRFMGLALVIVAVVGLYFLALYCLGIRKHHFRS
ncbi:murein biosynthesis protein MurJ [Piscirickettsia salmonis]|uniref:Probable lipid II flippase MurJ n=1 Tax=Piscirickettsia salmonis TaxID=1238 RepID=A0A9Q6LUF0_PISSA|nr:murein biosynthesis integral membrane protein MurJ [Piscirickettsia salmonis]ALA23909.1 membrane protein [Piscirickettsia salmonis]APS44325.1 murein biosynthesis protein MurJ [Piscirickettsia salmonis]APS47686.1 murein biosynthesis protein MurJ [Piscirickettsia salmonis]APS54087.1 murein biosynthesis protein MurJ [Piscirickettsia salmonis]QGN96185.1 putative peptidoglycan biosynthesis protein MurJ [Piscirickettsia salmonis]